MVSKAGARTQEGAGGQGRVGHVVPPSPQSLQHREWEAEEVLQGLPGGRRVPAEGEWLGPPCEKHAHPPCPAAGPPETCGLLGSKITAGQHLLWTG